MNKKIKTNEINQIKKWINDETSYAEMCRQIKVNPRTPSGYIRISVVLRSLFKTGELTIK